MHVCTYMYVCLHLLGGRKKLSCNGLHVCLHLPAPFQYAGTLSVCVFMVQFNVILYSRGDAPSVVAIIVACTVFFAFKLGRPTAVGGCGSIASQKLLLTTLI